MEPTRITVKLLKEASQEKNLDRAVVLDLHARNILRLEDMNKVPNTRSLDLSFNHISTVHGLEALSQLKELRLYNNVMGSKELVPLEGARCLTSLQTLLLHNNQLEDLVGIDTLKGLKTLRADGNPIQSMAGVRGLLALESLNLSGCQIEKMEGLGGLTALQELDLSRNQIKVVEGISRCTDLKELSLSDNPIGKISGLSKLTKLDVLRLERVGLPSLNVLPESLPLLTELFVAGNNIVSLQPLSSCPGLQTLDVSDNRLSSVKQSCAALSSLPELQELRLEGNPMAGGNPDKAFYQRLADAAQALKFLDEAPFSRSGPAGEEDPFAPSAEEMEAYKARMGIKTAVDVMGGRPATPRSRPATPGAGGAGAAGSRPGTPGDGKFTPMMYQRSSSSNRDRRRLMSPDAYKASVDKFTGDMQEYLDTMGGVLGTLKADMAKDPAAWAAELVSKGGGAPNYGAVTHALPAFPTVPNPPNFVVKDEEEEEARAEAKRVAKEKAKGASERATGRGSGGAGAEDGAQAGGESRPGSRGGAGALGVFEQLLGTAPSAALAEALAEDGAGARPGTADSGWSEASGGSDTVWEEGGFVSRPRSEAHAGGGSSAATPRGGGLLPPIPPSSPAAGVHPAADFGWGALLDYDVGSRHVLDGAGSARGDGGEGAGAGGFGAGEDGEAGEPQEAAVVLDKRAELRGEIRPDEVGGYRAFRPRPGSAGSRRPDSAGSRRPGSAAASEAASSLKRGEDAAAVSGTARAVTPRAAAGGGGKAGRPRLLSGRQAAAAAAPVLRPSPTAAPGPDVLAELLANGPTAPGRMIAGAGRRTSGGRGGEGAAVRGGAAGRPPSARHKGAGRKGSGRRGGGEQGKVAAAGPGAVVVGTPGPAAQPKAGSFKGRSWDA